MSFNSEIAIEIDGFKVILSPLNAIGAARPGGKDHMSSSRPATSCTQIL